MNTKSIQFVRRASLLLAGMLATSFLTACGGGGDDGVGGVTPGQNGTVEAGSASLPSGKDCGIGGMPQQLLAAINAARAQARMCGSTSMPAAPAIGYWNTRLADAAIRHSTDRTRVSGSGHEGSDGSTPQSRASDAGYQGAVGEIFYGAYGSKASSVSTTQAMNAWLKSPGHCQAIMDPLYSELGASCVKAGSVASYTVVFGLGS